MSKGEDEGAEDLAISSTRSSTCSSSNISNAPSSSSIHSTTRSSSMKELGAVVINSSGYQSGAGLASVAMVEGSLPGNEVPLIKWFRVYKRHILYPKASLSMFVLDRLLLLL